MITGKVHSGVAVKSLEKSIPFYRDVLGLELLGIEEPRRNQEVTSWQYRELSSRQLISRYREQMNRSSS